MLARPRLLRRLNSALTYGHAVIIAPGGYGKSILLRSLATQRPNTHYLALTPTDADRAVLQPRLEMFINAPKATLILDNVQHLDNDSETLHWLGESLSLPSQEHARLILSGRRVELPALPLLIAQHKVTRFGQTDLAFSHQESAALGISDEWHRRAEGWPLALALHQQISAQGANALDASLTTTQLFDTLAHSLLAGVPADLQRFLQLSAVPLRINTELAADLLGATPLESGALLREVQRRNFFLEECEPRGWFRYHDLIRDFLLRQFDPTAAYQTAVTWFERHDDLPMAIEHALTGRLFRRAAELLASLPADFVHTTGKYQTLRRWVNSLDAATRRLHPLILRDLAIALSEHSDRNESFSLLQEAVNYAEAQGDPEISTNIRLSIVTTHLTAGNPSDALAVLQSMPDQTAMPINLRRKYLKTLGGVHYYLSQFHRARYAFEAALALPDEGDRSATARLRQNLIVAALHPLGDFARAEQEWHLLEPIFAEQLIGRIWSLITACWLYESMGDWVRLASALKTIFALEEQSEELDEEDNGPLLLHLYQLIGQGKFVLATEIMDKLDHAPSQNSDLLMNVEICRVWLARRTGRFQDALDAADKALAQPWDLPWNRGIIAVEREIARFQDGAHSLEFGSEIKRLIELRARPWLMRLRALLALRCHRTGNPRWRVHLNSVLRTSQRYGYGNILITREPDLGAYFWTLCIEEEIAIEQATTALQRIGRTDLLCALLQHPSPAVRCRALRVLAEMGNEATIPTLAERLTTEKDGTVRAALESTIEKLETLPPPTLHVTLLGEFSAQRGDTPITADYWQRPAARRLFQYLVLNQGKPLPRDRILEELWPNSTPDAARSSFKTVYSWLRKAIEPYLRPKSSSRYIQVDQETYTFNPQRSPAILHSDVAKFEAVVKAVLKDADNYDVRPMPADFVAALDGWKPLLPELSYEPWILDTRERLQNLYVQGCLYAASAMLDIDKPIDAAGWAERVIAIAPWSEEGWQELIRAQARQGNRTLALKSYEAAVAALKRELDAPPSSVLEWLAKRLRADEEI